MALAARASSASGIETISVSTTRTRSAPAMRAPWTAASNVPLSLAEICSETTSSWSASNSR